MDTGLHAIVIRLKATPQDAVGTNCFIDEVLNNVRLDMVTRPLGTLMVESNLKHLIYSDLLRILEEFWKRSCWNYGQTTFGSFITMMY